MKATRAAGDGDGVGENFAHARVGREFLALDDADCGELAADLRLERLGRLLLHQRVEHLVREKSLGGMVFIERPVPSTKVGVPGLLNGASGALPVTKEPMLVP